MIPRRSKRLLPGNFGQEAINSKLLSGEIRGLRAPLPLHTFAPGTLPKRAWRVRRDDDPSEQYWVSSQFPNAELIKPPLLNDSFDRRYLFEPGQPAKVFTVDDLAAGTGPWNVAFTHPTVAPTLAIATPAPNERTVVYVYTYVTEWGEESPPSPPAEILAGDGSEVDVSGFYTPTPVIEGRAFEKVRIYRTVTFFGQGAFFYVGEVPWGTNTFTDSQSDAIVSFNETLSSQTFSSPPDGLFGARVHPSGALVAVKGRDVWFSEPYRPNAWPEVYKISVSDEIVGIEVWEQNVGVFTKGRPSLIYGPTPAQTGLLRFPMPDPCLSYGSIVGAPEGAYYASDQGLTLFTAVGPKNITRELISEEEWQSNYADERISAARYGTQYIAIERPQVGFIIDNLEPRIALTDIVFPDLAFVSLDEDYYTGRVYAVAGDTVYEWDPVVGEEVDWIWKSKQYIVEAPSNFGAVMVHIEPRENEYIPATALPVPPFPPEYAAIDKKTQVLVEVFMNDRRILAQPASDREQVRLPSGDKGDAWEIRITGQCRLYSVALTETGRGQARAG